MSDVAITVQNVWKKFHRGEIHDSLRDFIPAVAKRLVGRAPSCTELGDDDFWALRDVSFALRRGEALGVIGPNGAGKSTLMKLLSRIMRPNRGTYRINGRLRALLEVGAGFHNDLTGRENIYLNGAIIGMPKREIDRKLDAILDFSGIEPFIDTPIKRYSSGMRARLGFSVIAHLDPEILLVDEVLAVGDIAFRDKCIRRMQEMIRSDVSVVFISHRLEQVRQLCDRCLVLDHGAVRFSGDVDTACQAYLDCFRESEQHGRSSDAGELGQEGMLHGLTVRDEHGNRTNTIAAHRPLSMEITYELRRDFEDIVLAVKLSNHDGRELARCNTKYSPAPAPSTAGTHSFLLSLEGLPFCSGDYFLGIGLRDAQERRSLDVHDFRYPLNINGAQRGKQILDLRPSWSSVEPNVSQLPREA